MSAEKTEPRYNAARRIKWLAFFVVVAVVVLSVAWFAVARIIDNRLTAQIASLERSNIAVSCPGQTVAGFPFRFGIFCDATSVDLAQDGLRLEAGALRSAAQFYNPRHVIIELDGPLNISTLDTGARLTWETARASLVATGTVPDRASVELASPVVEANGSLVFSAETLTLHMRTVAADEGSADDLDVAIQAASLTRVGPVTRRTGLPALDFDADIRIDNGTALLGRNVRDLRVLAGQSGEIRRLAWLLSRDQGVLVSGPVSVTANGLLNAELTIRIIDVDAVVAAWNSAPFGLRDIGQIISSLPRTGEASDEVELPVSVRNGQASFGFIPLGTIPSLF